MGISVSTSKQSVTATVNDQTVKASVAGGNTSSATVTAGFGATGPQGPSGVVNVTAPITNAGTTTAADIGISLGEGLSVSSGSLRVTPGTYATSSHNHDASAINAGTLSADRLPLASANTRGAVRIGTGVAIDGNGVISVSIPSMDWDDITDKPSTFPPEAHTHTAADITSGTLSASLLPTSGVAAGTYTSVTVDTYGRVTAGSSPAIAYSSLTGLPTLGTAASQDSTAFAAASHNHSASDVTSGTLNAARLPLATTTTAGAVIVGTGLGVASGTISVTQFDVRSDVVSSTAYTGRAVAGSATSASVWTIRRSVYTSAGAVSSTATATNVKWDDRLTASYS